MRMPLVLLVASAAGLAHAQTWTTLDVPVVGRFVAADPTGAARLYFGSIDGLFTTGDAGVTWARRDRGLPERASGACPVQAMAFDAARPHAPIAGVGRRLDSTAGCGAYRGRGRGRRWQSLGIDDDAVSAVATAEQTVWTGSAGDGSDVAGRVMKRAGRRPWRVLHTFADVDTDVTAIVPVSGDTAYVATNHEGVLKTTDGGDTWTPANAGLPRFDFTSAPSPSGAFVFTIPLVGDPTASDTLYLGTLGYGSCCPDVVGVGGNVFTTRDGAATWNGGSGLAGVNVLALAVDPARPGTVYAGTTSGVFRSQDHGVTWAALGLDGGVVWSLAVARDGAALYAATGLLHRLSLAP
jgi:photosystem II stability/assembly factor-like uncharacterized protein